MDKYRLVLGLEIHLHPKTKTKMFCYCDANIYGAESNTHTCPVCLGLPGALPVPNEEAVQKTHLLGLALGCVLPSDSRFDRKHYFYPDLPKGYQISQYKKPLCEEGFLELSIKDSHGDNRVIEIERIHLEEDTAKSFHSGAKTLIDFNKSGMPLIEIVTKPVIRSVAEAVEFAEKIQHLVRFLGVSDADMEKGQLRVEPNISVRTKEMEDSNVLPDYKVEVKNINSFKFLAKAIESEMERQSKILEEGGKLIQENRGFDEKTGKTLPQRAKEDAKDYRYFPDPDIPPMHFDDKYFSELRSNLGELPWEIVQRYKSKFDLDSDKAYSLVYKMDKSICFMFEELVGQNLVATKVANMLINNISFQKMDINEFITAYKNSENKLSDDEELLKIATKVISENKKAVEDYQNGKEASLQFLLGMLMRETKGKADATVSTEIIKRLLNNL